MGLGLLRGTEPMVIASEQQDDQVEVEGEDSSGDATSTDDSASEGEVARFVVHVDGCVVAPGVYRLEGDDIRVAFDANRLHFFDKDTEATLLDR